MKKPNIPTALMSQTGMGRTGGMMSQGSKPNVMQNQGAQFAAMENLMLRKGAKNPKAITKGGNGRQFLKQKGDTA